MDFGSSAAEVRSIASPEGPGSAGLAFDGTHLWSVNRFSYQLSRLKPDYGEVLDSFPYRGVQPAGMTFDGLHLWIADAGDTSLHQLSWPGAEFERAIPAPGIEPSGVAWDGTNLWESDRLTGLLSRLDVADGNVEFQFRLPFSFPLGIAVDRNHGTVWALDRGANRTVELSFPPGPSHILNWHSADIDSTVALTWSMSEASTASSITVERRAATEAAYGPLGTARCDGQACSFVYPHPIVGAIAYYRLKVEELAGPSKYIGPLSVAHRFSYGPSGSLARPGELRAGARLNVSVGGNVRIWAVGLPGQTVRARLFDVRGQLVRVMELSESTQGVYGATWDRSRADGGPVRPGVYFAAVDATRGARAAVRITVLR